MMEIQKKTRSRGFVETPDVPDAKEKKRPRTFVETPQPKRNPFELKFQKWKHFRAPQISFAILI